MGSVQALETGVFTVKANAAVLKQKNKDVLNKSVLLMFTFLVPQTVSKRTLGTAKKYNELHLVNEYTLSCTII
jgi:hypothetical protein